MRSSSALSGLLCASVVIGLGSISRVATAQSAAQGFAVERLYLSAPGAGWFVMDDLGMHGGLGGAIALTTSYARKPFRVGSGTDVPVVSDELFTDFGFAATYNRFRLYVNIDAPLSTNGQSSSSDGYQFSAPALTLSSHPDSLSDARIGTDARLLGEADSSFRLGVGAQLIFPTGKRPDYDSDGTYRAMGRLLFAGDVGSFSYAGQLGAHVRPLDQAPAPDGPRGSELLFGAAAGLKFPANESGSVAVLIGPEVFGETAFTSFFGSNATGVEGLLTARLESADDRGSLLRFKLGAGGGLDPHFGAPEWRVVGAIEVSDQLSPH
ncbi:MAG TPA: hypothetical protein VK745_24205 [Polyangiaceae bacterium]|nr:hypothetical protein [Polyangiaceae bacterium]